MNYLLKRLKSLSLFWRIYSYALLILLLIFITATIIHLSIDLPTSLHRTPERIAVVIADTLRENINNDAQLQKELNSLHFLVQHSFSVYDFDGNLLAKAGPTNFAPLSQEKLATLGKRSVFGRGFLALPLPEYHRESYFIIGRDRAGIHKRFPVLLAVFLLFLALLSYPITRIILGPVRKISQTASALAKGDLSARTRLARGDELGILADTIDNMAARLDNIIKTEREMLANISHEFRTPLARMRVALELSEEEVNIKKIQSYVGELGEDIDELDQLINDVLMTVRLQLNTEESEPIRIIQKPIVLDDFLKRIVKRVQQKHQWFSIIIKSKNLPPIINGDPLLLQRVFANIFENCRKHSRSREAVEVYINSTDKLNFSIVDHGLGISENDRQRLFKPFFQSDYSRSKGGVGLGLTLSKRIIEAHKGTISLTHTQGSGLTVNITLPSKKVSQDNLTSNNKINKGSPST